MYYYPIYPVMGNQNHPNQMLVIRGKKCYVIKV